MKKYISIYLLLAGLLAGNCLTVSAQSDTLKENRLKRYWNSLVHGNVDRTFEKRMDMSYVVAPCYTREGSFGIGGMVFLYLLQPLFKKLTGKMSDRVLYTVSLFLLILFIADIIYTYCF